ncbi:MAG TPA: hypothetical protein VGX48_08335 [Pyrinomonadaceae bacterium]|jgi:hypothetical protein|nr:hypothetical protein [Pyrinomonadaceae bacterium]
MASFLLSNCAGDSGPRLLAVGGIHVFESGGPCRLARAEPEGALKDLGWPDALALEAAREGDAEVTCGDEKFALKALPPARLEIKLPDGGAPTGIPVQKPFKVQAMLYDAQGRELEVGKFTHFEWTPSEGLEPANDPSAGEFGLCDTCFGLHNFRAVKPGQGSIVASLGGLKGELLIEAHL